MSNLKLFGEQAANALLRAIVGLAMLTICQSTHAAFADCIGTSLDGRAECAKPIPQINGDPLRDSEGFSNDICDTFTNFIAYEAAQCRAGSGTWNGPYGSPPCLGFIRPVTVGELVAWEKRVIELYMNACNVQVPLALGLRVGQRCEIVLSNDEGESHYATVVRTEPIAKAPNPIVGAGLRFDQPLFL